MSRVVLFVRWELGRHEHTQCDQKVNYNPTIVALVMLMCVLGLPPFQRTDCALFSLFVCVQACFSQREKAYQAWQIAQTNLIKEREQEGKLQAAGNTEKVKLCQEEIVQMETRVEKGEEEFNNISKVMRAEIERFEGQRKKDFKASILRYMEKMMRNQEQLIKYWEAFLPEAKSIA
ncbi:sorting nexin-2-like [Sycon ciliatum]|uniref:sorting nexin-2-like n=1 Tax=Sycon ciliatum TaxID=27933 RepID=UPI0031F61F3C